jgi:hypothetical protein
MRALCLALLCLPALVSAFPNAPAEQLARVDSDGDGRVNRAEYRAWMGRGFRAMDVNGDGVLQPQELPPGTSFRRGQALTLDEHHARLDARFDLQDVDGDGFLDVRELTAPPRPAQ